MIIAVDPSGIGTTGICCFRHREDYITLAISANEYPNKYAYWDEILNTLTLIPTNPEEPVALVIENYILYPEKAAPQSYDTLETPRLLGTLEHEFRDRINWQRAADVMQRWTKEILQHDMYITLNGRKSAFNPNTEERICEHELDALRHAVHAHTFRKEKLKWF